MGTLAPKKTTDIQERLNCIVDRLAGEQHNVEGEQETMVNQPILPQAEAQFILKGKTVNDRLDKELQMLLYWDDAYEIFVTHCIFHRKMDVKLTGTP